MRVRGRIVVGLAALASALGLLAAPALAAGPADWLYEPTTFTEMRLELPPSAYAELEDKEFDEYVKGGTLSIAETDGTPGTAGPFSNPVEVEVKLKGGLGSRRSIDEKAGLKIKFVKKADRPYGLKKLTLNNMVQDESQIHETLAYGAFRAMGLTAPHTGFTYLWVNGKSYGLHLNLETPDDLFLEKEFGYFDDSVQHLYEGEYGADITTATGTKPGSTKPAWEEFEVDEGEEDTKADLEALLAAVEGSTGSFSQRVTSYADLPQMARMWMTEKFIGHWDGYSGYAPGHILPNNFYLYSDPSGKFQMLPWGTDQTWSDRTPFASPGGRLFALCLADSAGCASLYQGAGKDLLSTLTVADLDKAARCTAADVGPWRRYEDETSEPSKQPPYDLSETAARQAETREFIAERPTELANYLGEGAPPKTSDQSACPPLRPIGGFKPPVEPPVTPEQPPAPRSGPAASGSGGAGEPPAPPAPMVKLGRRTTTADAVDVRLYASGPGTVQLLGTYGIGAGRRATACRGSAEVAAAGRLEVRCALTPGFRNRLAGRAIPMRIGVSLTGAGGTTRSSLKLTLPRR
jgi:hypothetical protein